MNIRETIISNAMREIQARHQNGDCPSKLRFCQLNGLNRKTLSPSRSCTMNATTILKLCKAIGCTPNDLLNGLY